MLMGFRPRVSYKTRPPQGRKTAVPDLEFERLRKKNARLAKRLKQVKVRKVITDKLL